MQRVIRFLTPNGSTIMYSVIFIYHPKREIVMKHGGSKESLGFRRITMILTHCTKKILSVPARLIFQRFL
jgi:hypothetical protein